MVLNSLDIKSQFLSVLFQFLSFPVGFTRLQSRDSQYITGHFSHSLALPSQSMDYDGSTPVIIGVGDVKNRSQNTDDAIEPMHLMLQAILEALRDATSAPSCRQKLRSSIDSVSVVATWTWPYADLPGLLAENLGIKPKHKFYSEHGGNQPIKLVDEAARSISQGRSRVAIVTGGEALASRKTMEQHEDLLITDVLTLRQ